MKKEEQEPLVIYCLVKMKPNSQARSFLDEVRKFPCVREAKSVLGEFDAIVVFESTDFRKMARFAAEELRYVKQIESISSHICP